MGSAPDEPLVELPPLNVDESGIELIFGDHPEEERQPAKEPSTSAAPSTSGATVSGNTRSSAPAVVEEEAVPPTVNFWEDESAISRKAISAARNVPDQGKYTQFCSHSYLIYNIILILLFSSYTDHIFPYDCLLYTSRCV